MNAPERALNLDATRANSGVHTRSSFETPVHRPEDEDLQALVQRASSRPPAPSTDFAEIQIPRLPPLMMDDLPGLLVPPPLSVEPAAKPHALSAGVKAMIALPWALLVVGGATVAVMWPRAEGGALTQAVAAASTLAPALAGAAEPSLAVAVAAVQPGAAGEPGLVEAIAPAVASAQNAPVGTSSRELRAAAAQAAATAVETRDAEAVTPTAEPATPAAEGATVPAAEALVAAPATPAATVTPSAAPNGTTFEAIQARLAAGGSTAAATPAAGETTLPERPSRGEVVRALRSVQNAVDACTADVGTAMVRITVAGDGTVTAASATGDYAGTSAGSCMADAVRGARFAPFTASTMTITYPFTLR